MLIYRFERKIENRKPPSAIRFCSLQRQFYSQIPLRCGVYRMRADREQAREECREQGGEGEGAVKVERKKANIYSEARHTDQGQLQRQGPVQQLCNYAQIMHGTEIPRTLHGEAGQETLGHHEGGV